MAVAPSDLEEDVFERRLANVDIENLDSGIANGEYRLRHQVLLSADDDDVLGRQRHISKASLQRARHQLRLTLELHAQDRVLDALRESGGRVLRHDVTVIQKDHLV